MVLRSIMLSRKSKLFDIAAIAAESEVSVPAEFMISRVASAHISIRWRSCLARSCMRLSDTYINVAATAIAAMINSNFPKERISYMLAMTCDLTSKV